MTPTDAELRKALDTMRIWISEDAHLGESTISYELEKAEGLRKLDAIEQAIAATVGNAQEPTNAVIERIDRFCNDYAQCLVDATLHDKRPFDAVDHLTCESMEAVEDKLIRELAEDIAKVGTGTCTMEPDGYHGEQYGIYKCSNCGELWQFEVEGPKEHGWTCCPKCQARIKEDE